MKIRGPKTDPCGTPPIMGLIADEIPLRFPKNDQTWSINEQSVVADLVTQKLHKLL